MLGMQISVVSWPACGDACMVPPVHRARNGRPSRFLCAQDLIANADLSRHIESLRGAVWPSISRLEWPMRLRSDLVRAVQCLLLMCAWVPMAQARLGPGEYVLNDQQSICLKADGQWYGTSFAGWGGQWLETEDRLMIFGNYAEGAGNDAMVFSNRFPGLTRHNPGSWTEWRDDGSWQAVLPHAFLYKIVKGECVSPPAKVGPDGPADPMSARRR
jgi:hypothetical protein